ncbi:response regulator transcription factor [Bradyrhizobium sp. CCGUVB23]|uniref:response regulator transcription factor n=1 Tax=Bradyrhizobium sp. CCGUVB23 TaxID=2949630 RepID=UPI0020B17F29|nr:LuxR C-terminal-related transcriptional regulator [Bradyrhizobium sp. CCGUVB23]MCP3460117.1 LuxR C-terminal-related transcriptional regulator [Bradyrhizobium sp. CCGUVB23]
MLKFLTKRELQIAHLVSEGLSNKAIGRRLETSDGTVKVHLHNIFQKLQIDKRAALIAMVIRNEKPAQIAVQD